MKKSYFNFNLVFDVELKILCLCDFYRNRKLRLKSLSFKLPLVLFYIVRIVLEFGFCLY